MARRPGGRLEIEKYELERKENARRTRRRRRRQPLIALLVVLLAVTAGVTLSLTFFFKIKKIEVRGDSDYYKAEQIADSSGVKISDNLIRVREADVEANILRERVYIRSVTIEKQFPDYLVIAFVQDDPAYNVVTDEGVLLIDDVGKILKAVQEPDSGLPVILGITPEKTTPGTMTADEDAQRTQILRTLLEAIQGGTQPPVTSIDLTDKYDLHITFDGRIQFDMGSAGSMDYKLRMAQTVIAQLAPDEVGYLSMVGDNQCAFRKKSAVDRQAAAAERAKHETDSTGGVGLPDSQLEEPEEPAEAAPDDDEPDAYEEPAEYEAPEEEQAEVDENGNIAYYQ